MLDNYLFFFFEKQTHTHKGEENDYFNRMYVKIGNKMYGALLAKVFLGAGS